jgi:hypothetical protein
MIHEGSIDLTSILFGFDNMYNKIIEFTLHYNESVFDHANVDDDDG